MSIYNALLPVMLSLTFLFLMKPFCNWLARKICGMPKEKRILRVEHECDYIPDSGSCTECNLNTARAFLGVREL